MAQLCETFPDVPPKKILFLGDEKTGKTTFIKNYCEHYRDLNRCEFYEGKYLVFTQYRLYLERLEDPAPILLLDLPAGTTEESREGQYPDEIDLIVLCYAIDDTNSFANVTNKWLPECRQYYPRDTRMYLLGLKKDTRDALLEEDRMPVTAVRALRVHEQNEFRGQPLECSVEENPEHARDSMDSLINDTFHGHSPRVSI